MQTVTAAALLEIWERGLDLSPGERGLLLLKVAHPEVLPETLASWTVGERDSALLVLRERLFGPQIAALAECPQCAQSLEMDFPISAITVPPSNATPRQFALESDGCYLSYRLPTAGDLAELGRTGGQASGRWLVRRCLERVDRRQAASGESATGFRKAEMSAKRDVVVVEELPDPVWETLEVAIADNVEQCDPQAEIKLALNCPSCGRRWQAPFDIVGFLWRELDGWAVRLLREIHILASAYGWSEPQILALSSQRRQHYLLLIGK